jgi:hypothetical protein
MAKPFTCNTRSPAGNLILGALFLGCALLLIATPCLGVVGMAFGAVSAPKGPQEIPEIVFMLEVCLVLAAALLGLGVLCMHATLLPKTVEVNDEAVELRWFKRRLGRVPLANVRDVFVQTRAMAGQTAQGAFEQGAFRGGLIGGLVAQSRFDPNETIGFVIRLADGDDPDTFWPKGFFGKAPKKRLEVFHYWKVPHDRLVEKIAKAAARHKERAIRP